MAGLRLSLFGATGPALYPYGGMLSHLSGCDVWGAQGWGLVPRETVINAEVKAYASLCSAQR